MVMAPDNHDRHDFYNQLAIIMGFCDLLIEESSPDDPRRHDFKEIHKAATTAHRLARRLLPALHDKA